MTPECTALRYISKSGSRDAYVQTIAELTGVSVSKRSLEEILPDAARDFDAFYRQRSVATAVGAILLAAVDAKGIPMVKPCGAQPKARLTKGEKANKKRMATVATVFSRAPWVSAKASPNAACPVPNAKP